MVRLFPVPTLFCGVSKTMTDNHLDPTDQPDPVTGKSTEAEERDLGTQRVSLKLLGVSGAVFLVIGAVTWIISLSSVKGFSEENPTAVKADTSYYLLADEDALEATACGFFGPNSEPIHDKVKDLEDLTGENVKIRDVSLPFTTVKGVYARVEFTENVQDAHIVCNEGKNYISAKSGSSLDTLRWISMIGVGSGITLLVVSAVLRGRENR